MIEKFKQRITFYLFGFGLGLVILFLTFGNRGCSWLPGNRVKNMIAEKDILAGDSVLEVMICKGLTNTDIYSVLNDNGDVNFSESVTDVYPKIYLIEGLKNEATLGITFALYDTLAEVIGVHFDNATCVVNTSNKTKHIVPLPDADVRAIIESHEQRIVNRAACELECLGLSEADVLAFYKNAHFVSEKSRPRLYPDPFYVMEGNMKNKTYQITYVISENRSRITNIEPDTCACE
ncbi:MAG: hypothetical protein IPM74_03830 [Crocinitomicaceae bacterium]|nr:hypothetical protein [Crocinitomicaceae bacterium]MBK8925043.1 hypothetical protein [Crocinitomicaceae bacterium]